MGLTNVIGGSLDLAPAARMSPPVIRHSWLTLCLCLTVSGSAWAQVEVVTVVKEEPICSNTEDPQIDEPVDVCNVYVRLSAPSIKLLAVGGADITTDDPAGFYQHTFGSVIAPGCEFLPIFPSLACDSFVTLGLKCSAGSDATATDGDFSSGEFNTNGHVVGGWFNGLPTNEQGLPDENGDVLVAQFAVTGGFDIFGSFTAYVQGDFDGAPGVCPDLDDDEVVSAFDLGLLLGMWGPCPECPADFDGDGMVGEVDLAWMLNGWGVCGESMLPFEPFEFDFSCFGAPCKTAPDCDDEDPCTSDTCLDGACVNSPADCNDNLTPDCEEIAEQTSTDCNGNSIPDECEIGARVHYVDDDGLPENGCTCWTDACPDLQTALALAQPGEQIWVAAGTYKPAPPFGDRAETFQLLDGVALYGGFAGFEESVAGRAGLFDQTVLSGDLLSDDEPLEFPAGPSYGENSYHVVSGGGTSLGAILDGFKITGGNADGDFPDNQGGGLFNETGSPTLARCSLGGNAAEYGGAIANTNGSSPSFTDCIIAGNYAMFNGGGTYNFVPSAPTFVDCTFGGNSADVGGGMFSVGSSPTVTDCVFAENSAVTTGGGMVNFSSSAPLVTGSTFVGNSAGQFGGGMFNQNSADATVIDCLFSVNVASSAGGGMHNWDCDPIISKCRFLGNASTGSNGGGVYNNGGNPIMISNSLAGNTASFVGGGIYNANATVTIANCAFSGNFAFQDEGGGIYNATNTIATVTNCTLSRNEAQASGAGIYSWNSSDTTVTNSILWGNIVDGRTDSAAQIDDDGTGTTTVDYSDIQGGWSGAGGLANLNADPLFVDPDGPDNITGTADDDLSLLSGSPVLDGADNNALPADTSDLDEDDDLAEPLPFDLSGGNRLVDVPAAPDCPQPKGDCGVAPIADMGAYELGADCNDNGIPDFLDIENETSEDCNANGVPDECEVPPIGPPENDCNLNNTPDDCDIADFTSSDCNNNDIPDECELPVSSGGLCTEDCASDCDDNGAIDTCDMADCAPEDPACDDCNLNGVLDKCDIEPLDPDGNGHSSDDDDEDGVPDECVAAQASGNWSEDIWGLMGENPYPDNQQGVPDQAVTLDDVAVFLDVDAEVPALRLINAATLDVALNDEPGDLTIADAAGVFDGNLLIKGILSIGNEHVIDAAGTVTIGQDGIYKSILAFEGLSNGDMMAEEIVVECGGSLLLEGTMSVSTGGDLTMQDSEDDGKGDCTPPDFEAGDDSTTAVGGDFNIQGPANINFNSTQPLLLGGNFNNQSTDPMIFDWTAGGVSFDGPLQTIEAAGENRGPWPAGFVDNFAIGTLTLSANSLVHVVDVFDNQQDGATACDEALYVELLQVESGATLFTEGCPLYFSQLINDGSILDLGVSVLQILEPVPADFNRNGTVDAFDLAFLLGNWGDCPEPCTQGDPVDTCTTDLDGDCDTGAFDLATLLGAWGPT